MPEDRNDICDINDMLTYLNSNGRVLSQDRTGRFLVGSNRFRPLKIELSSPSERNGILKASFLLRDDPYWTVSVAPLLQRNELDRIKVLKD